MNQNPLHFEHPYRAYVEYVDDAIIVVNKPAEVLSVPGRGVEKQDSLTTRIQQIYSDALNVHRLDMATSGLMVMARHKQAHRFLSMAFANRHVQKRYLAWVAGIPGQMSGIINYPLITDWPNRPKQKICYEHGKPSLTHWRLLKSSSDTNTSFLELEPVTGRSHQLRVHLAAIGYPILNDVFYAPLAYIQEGERMMLHSHYLEFTHPETGMLMQFDSKADFLSE